MAGCSNKEFQDLEQDFEIIEKESVAKKSVKEYDALQCELEMEYEVITIEDVYADPESEENKTPKKRLDEIEGTSWSDYASKIVEHTKNGGKYKILSQLLHYGIERTETYDTNWKMAESFLIVKNCEMGMINYKRMGWTPDENVSWAEINLALVEATTLLCVLSDKMEVRFKNFLPVPHEYKSFIIELSDQRVLPLFGEGEFRRFRNKEFDDALVGFLDCIKDLNAGIKNTTPQQNIPHDIEDDKLLDPIPERQYTVRLQEATNHKRWTRALMFMLTNLKWLVQWVVLFIHKLDPFPLPELWKLLQEHNHENAT